MLDVRKFGPRLSKKEPVAGLHPSAPDPITKQVSPGEIQWFV